MEAKAKARMGKLGTILSRLGRTGSGGNKTRSVAPTSPKSRSWPRSTVEVECSGDFRRPEKGCFSVYVGLERRRFVVKTEYANHPLFRMLLEEAESVYGNNAGGPIVLPCDVELFESVMAEVSSESEETVRGRGCAAFSKGSMSYQLLSPARFRVR